MNAQPVFCCAFMAQLFSGGSVRLRALKDQGYIAASLGSFDNYIPLNFCPSCGKEFRLTFMTDSEVYR